MSSNDEMMEPEVIEAKPEKKKPGRKPKAEAKTQADPELVEMLLQKFQEMMQANSDNTLALAESLRKPTELEQKKLDEERAQRLKRHEMAVKVAQQEEVMRQRRQAACRAEGHQDSHGNTRFRGQIHSDGMIHPVCQKCRIEMPPIKAQPGQTSVDMWQWKGVTEETLTNMAKMTTQGA